MDLPPLGLQMLLGRVVNQPIVEVRTHPPVGDGAQGDPEVDVIAARDDRGVVKDWVGETKDFVRSLHRPPLGFMAGSKGGLPTKWTNQHSPLLPERDLS